MTLLTQAKKSLEIIQQSINHDMLSVERCVELSSELESTIKELESSPLRDEEFLKTITTLQLIRLELELHISYLSNASTGRKSS